MSLTAASMSTTCLVVSRPESTDYVTYSSGQTPFIETTTYTAATTVAWTQSATIQARCFTLTPGESLPPSISFVGADCTTESFSERTDYLTYTSGENLFGLTVTEDKTVTQVLKPTSYVFCSPLPDYKNPATCDTVTPITWASLAITFITIQLTWWVFDVPLLWAKGGGIKAFLDAVSWACTRSHSPSSAGSIAASKGHGTGEFARVYYLGMRRQTAPPEWTLWKYCTCLGADLLSVAATIVTVYQACTLAQFDARRFGLSLWAYPSLPVALIGLCLLAGERFFPRTARASRWLFVMTLSVLVVTGMMIALVLWRFNKTDDVWWLSVLLYGFMLLPVIFLHRLAPPLLLFSWFVRVGGVSFAALKHYNGGQPYCKIQGIGFAVVYMVLGGIAAILGIFGAFYHAKSAPLFKPRPAEGTLYQ